MYLLFNLLPQSQNLVDLTQFNRLCQLVLHIPSFPSFEMALSTFATIPPVNRISRVSIVYLSARLDLFGCLDDLLFGMLLADLTQVVVFAQPRNVEAVKNRLPKLHSRKLLSVEPLSDAAYFRQGAVMRMS
jgi:hypothetical protein